MAVDIVKLAWKPWKVYDQELAENENKKEIFLVDRGYLPQITSEFARKIRNS